MKHLTASSAPKAAKRFCDRLGKARQSVQSDPIAARHETVAKFQTEHQAVEHIIKRTEDVAADWRQAAEATGKHGDLIAACILLGVGKEAMWLARATASRAYASARKAQDRLDKHDDVIRDVIGIYLSRLESP